MEAVARHRLVRFLPEGRLLPEPDWQRRHRLLTVLLGLAAVGLAAFGVAAGYGTGNTLRELAIVVLGLLGAVLPLGRGIRAASTSVGLLTAGGVLVHFWGGSTEAAFVFFVIVALLTLYQDWLPFLIAILYVVLHFGVIGSAHPTYVFDHPDAWRNPWEYALIYGGFVAAMSAAGVIAWRANEQLLRDALTGLPSRTVFMDRVAASIKNRKVCTVLYFDLDDFKRVNDRRGHAAGDEVLRIVAARTARVIREGQTVTRLAGDEFAVLCPDIRTESAARALAQRIIAALQEPAAVGRSRLKIRASVGVAVSARKMRAEELLERADRAMYRAKQAGKGRVAVAR